MKKEIIVEGMSCGHCVKHVSEALNEISGVKKVEVNLDSKIAIIESNEYIKDEDIKAVIEEVGYEVASINE